MTTDDESELHRLCDLLRGVTKQFPSDSPQAEALTKASFGLTLAFIHGLRPEIEDLMLGVGRPLTEAQKEHLRSLGIDPDADIP